MRIVTANVSANVSARARASVSVSANVSASASASASASVSVSKIFFCEKRGNDVERDQGIWLFVSSSVANIV